MEKPGRTVFISNLGFRPVLSSHISESHVRLVE